MATLFKVDGTTSEVLPANGRAFTLEEMQQNVGGYVETLSLPSGQIMLLDEDGKLKHKSYNARATKLGKLAGILPSDYIVGDVLVCNASELEDEE